MLHTWILALWPMTPPLHAPHFHIPPSAPLRGRSGRREDGGCEPANKDDVREAGRCSLNEGPCGQFLSDFRIREKKKTSAFIIRCYKSHLKWSE